MCFAKIIEQIKLRRAFRIWSNKNYQKSSLRSPLKQQYINTNITYNPKIKNLLSPNYTIIDQNNFFKIESPKVDIKQKQEEKLPLNLKFGDIIYFKCYIDQRKKGIVSGDGIANNQLECLPQEFIDIFEAFEKKDNQRKSSKNFSVFNKSAQLQFRKCLFQIVNEKKYYYQDKFYKAKLLEEENLKFEAMAQLENKTKKEFEENETNYERLIGLNINYGQGFQLKHVFSQCYLTLNQDILASENGCREMVLQQVSNQYSNFTIYSVKGSKEVGEPVLYSDQINIRNLQNKQYWLNVNKLKQNQQYNQGLEVNASETNTAFKVCCYMDYKTNIERESSKGKILQVGEIVHLYNKSLSGFLAIKNNFDMKKILSERVNIFSYNNNKFYMNQDYLDFNYTKHQLRNLFELCVHKENDSAYTQEEQSKIMQENQDFNIYILWEIQKIESFSSTLPKYKEKFRIKNVCTGLYLVLQNNKLELTYDGGLKECEFYLHPNRYFELNSNIVYNNTIKIQASNTKGGTSIVFVQEDEGENESKVICKEKQDLDKKNIEMTYFDVTPSDQNKRIIADQISSLFPSLFEFYGFLQNWGIEFNNLEISYTYKCAFDNQKELNNKLQHLQQTIQNLNQFLDVEDSILYKRQIILLQNGIVNLIVYILKQIHFKIYGQHQGDNQFVQINERSPSKIAQIQLNQAVQYLYQVLVQTIKGNSQIASYILSHKNNFLGFFLNQLEFYSVKKIFMYLQQYQQQYIINFILIYISIYIKKEVKVLLKETVKWMEATEEKEEENIQIWTSKLQTINYKNIEIQTFIAELLELSIQSPLGKAITQNQKYCRKYIFKYPIKKPKFDYSLIRFEFRDNIPIIIFNKPEEIGTDRNFEINNEKLILLYEEARKSQELKMKTFKQGIQNNYYELKFINGFIEKKLKTKSLGILQQYEDYVIQVLQLYVSLCKERNPKIIEILNNQVGLTKTFVKECIKIFNPFDFNQSQFYHLRYYNCFLGLYQQFLIDVEPLMRISENLNSCLIREDLKSFTITDRSFKLFQKYTIKSKYKADMANTLKMNMKELEQKEINEENDYVKYQLFKQYAEQIVMQEENIYKHSQELINQLFTESNEIPQQLNIKLHMDMKNKNPNINIDIEKFSLYLLDVILSSLNVVKNRIDLGFNDLASNRRIIKYLPNIFVGYIQFWSVQKDENFVHFKNYKKNWLCAFMFDNLQLCKDNFIVVKVYYFYIIIFFYFIFLKKRYYQKHQIYLRYQKIQIEAQQQQIKQKEKWVKEQTL
ncbi:hypothetical protein IMG5_057070 [Ichthyophthirius multifiliis]|uniref:Inositol 1,4,5-trisphosphate/ryanodine receptor domain-containing protein n=1 Tax=Ichthyophthirius multifiliis TaxID=5932 RepID=G0QNB9_ICHMU|nr:hypothetical protein IMG5_057070 [Ichthyophthirius multifiliis]EGR33284.1 hypothetical protein IMG5_057070 [Ichthyophthirius multifiliis]|eukprot:XP_004037270.1 hypothetical protein IMG5_057070 [Ichthyophthirius multifiliis]